MGALSLSREGRAPPGIPLRRKNVGHDQTSDIRLPLEPIQKLSGPFQRFVHIEAASGIHCSKPWRA